MERITGIVTNCESLHRHEARCSFLFRPVGIRLFPKGDPLATVVYKFLKKGGDVFYCESYFNCDWSEKSNKFHFVNGRGEGFLGGRVAKWIARGQEFTKVLALPAEIWRNFGILQILDVHLLVSGIRIVKGYLEFDVR